MDYPWLDRFVMHAAPEDEVGDPTLETPPDEGVTEDIPPDEDTGTNEPVSAPEENPDEQPNPELAKDITDSEPMGDAGTGAETGGEDTSQLQTQIDDLKKQLEDLKSESDAKEQIEIIKKRLENLQVPDDPDLNDSIFQSASQEICYLRRAIRRYAKKLPLTGEQKDLINLKLEQQPEASFQEIAAEMSKEIGADEQNIIDYIRNSEFRFRHRHRRQSSVIDWEAI